LETPIRKTPDFRPHRSITTVRWFTPLGVALSLIGLLCLISLMAPSRAYAAIVATIDLGTADSFSVLSGQTVTNTGPTVLDRDLGVSPLDSITGFPPGIVGGAEHAGDAVAGQAQSDLTTAYNDAAGRPSNFDITGEELGGQTLIGGVYTASSSSGLTGELTLNGEGNSNSVFIFQVGSALITGTNSSVSLINGAQACNVFWQVGSSATLGVGTDFVGDILALTSISVQTGATVQGRALARNGSATLDTNVFVAEDCEDSPSPSESDSESASPTVTDSASATESASSSESATESATSTESATESATSTESATESASSTESESATESASSTESESATESESTSRTDSNATENKNSTGTGDNLADTGATSNPLVGYVGALLVILGCLIIAVARVGKRPAGRHL